MWLFPRQFTAELKQKARPWLDSLVQMGAAFGAVHPFAAAAALGWPQARVGPQARVESLPGPATEQLPGPLPGPPAEDFFGVSLPLPPAPPLSTLDGLPPPEDLTPSQVDDLFGVEWLMDVA